MAEAYWGGRTPRSPGDQFGPGGLLGNGAQPQTPFPRFDFGGGGNRSPYQNPYMPQSVSVQQQGVQGPTPTPGLLGGAIGQLQSGDVAGVFGAGAVPSAAQGSNEGFGPGAAPAGAGQGWQNFQFQNPESDFQKNYNYLHGQDPELARAYGFSPFHAQEFKTALDPTNSGTGSALLNSYYGGGSAGQTGTMQSLGLPSDWKAKYDPQWVGSMFGGDGQTITAGGKTYNLPTADKKYLPADPRGAAMTDSPLDFSQFGLAKTR